MNNIAFDISSFLMLNDNQKKIEANKDGVYEKLPLMVLGKVSRNNKDYEINSMVDAISNKSSAFYRRLVAGQLFGEIGHPVVTDEKDISRILVIDPTRISHQIHRVYTGETTEKGHTIVYGDIEPAKPYGNVLAESLANPRRNTAFSLRSLVSKIGQSGSVIRQRVCALVTVDFVDCPGYSEASKVHVPGLEGCSIDIDPTNNISVIADLIGAESINDQMLLDILQTNKVTIMNTYNGTVDKKTLSVITDTGKKQLFHELF